MPEEPQSTAAPTDPSVEEQDENAGAEQDAEYQAYLASFAANRQAEEAPSDDGKEKPKTTVKQRGDTTSISTATTATPKTTTTKVSAAPSDASAEGVEVTSVGSESKDARASREGNKIKIDLTKELEIPGSVFEDPLSYGEWKQLRQADHDNKIAKLEEAKREYQEALDASGGNQDAVNNYFGGRQPGESFNDFQNRRLQELEEAKRAYQEALDATGEDHNAATNYINDRKPAENYQDWKKRAADEAAAKQKELEQAQQNQAARQARGEHTPEELDQAAQDAERERQEAEDAARRARGEYTPEELEDEARKAEQERQQAEDEARRARGEYTPEELEEMARTAAEKDQADKDAARRARGEFTPEELRAAQQDAERGDQAAKDKARRARGEYSRAELEQAAREAEREQQATKRPGTDDLLKGDLGDEAEEPKQPSEPEEAPSEGAEPTQPGAQPELSPEAQNDAAAELAANRDKIAQLEKLKQTIQSEVTNFKNDLAKGKLLGLIRKVVPPIDSILKKLESASLESQYRILRTLRSTLQLAKIGAGFADGLQTWGEAVALTWPTLIVPVLLVLIFIPWILLYMLAGSAIPGAALSKAVAQLIKKIDELLKPLEEHIKREKTKKSLTARITQLESAIISGAQRPGVPANDNAIPAAGGMSAPQPARVPAGAPANDNASAAARPTTMGVGAPANDNGLARQKNAA